MCTCLVQTQAHQYKSLKWCMYALMYWYQAKHVPERYISNFKPVSFDLVVNLSVHSLKVYV